MKNKKIFMGKIFVFICALINCQDIKVNDKLKEKNCFPMIWNQRVSKRSWIYLNQGETKIYRKNSDISDGDYLKMPKNNWDAIYTDAQTNQKFSTVNKTNASFKLVTLGYKAEDQKKTVGFDFMVLNKDKKNKPYVFRIINNSQKENPETSGALREVGFVFDNWPQYWPGEKKWTGGQHSFSDNYEVDKLNNLIVKFQFKLVYFNAPLNKKLIQKKWLGSYATCDLRFNEYDENGNVLNRYLIGVVFSNPFNADYNDNKDDAIFYGLGRAPSGEQQVLLLHGSKSGIKEINTISTKNVFETVDLDFKPLINRYLYLKKANVKNRYIITGLDIYSATRAADFTFEIQDIQVTGCK
ncbi:hypothetical protein [Chryseobacterium hagamense]|uniref:Uncharacterized protein n=1 Tax=Chryseobacterium hagamense TaxID=395935 RepID=A0A511YLS9_9FLAO|nr:hypothetical protein [Chryseobacterium hagamense]GEN76152.1 hypothetical protein CHA01nite_18920 [Chryseobacterium hagamense]